MKYVSGHPDLGQSPETGFDCSGFVSFVLRSSGLHIPKFIGMDDQIRPIRHASEYWDHYGLFVHSRYKQLGDLALFSRNGVLPTHIGIVLDDERYIHSPGRDGEYVEVTYFTDKQITQDKPGQLYETNTIGFKALVLPHNNPTYRYHQQLLAFE